LAVARLNHILKTRQRLLDNPPPPAPTITPATHTTPPTPPPPPADSENGDLHPSPPMENDEEPADDPAAVASPSGSSGDPLQYNTPIPQLSPHMSQPHEDAAPPAPSNEPTREHDTSPIIHQYHMPVPSSNCTVSDRCPTSPHTNERNATTQHTRPAIRNHPRPTKRARTTNEATQSERADRTCGKRQRSPSDAGPPRKRHSYPVATPRLPNAEPPPPHVTTDTRTTVQTRACTRANTHFHVAATEPNLRPRLHPSLRPPTKRRNMADRRVSTTHITTAYSLPHTIMTTNSAPRQRLIP
jgi:hypothetical protein